MENLKAWFKDNSFITVKDGMSRLTDELGISVKEYEEEGLFVLNYSQFLSPKDHPVVMECRGIILNNTLDVVCLPFDRFFNLGEIPGDEEVIDLVEADIFEKADGSLVKVYNHNGMWRIATRGTAFAESANYTGETFESLILAAFGCSDIVDFQQKMEKAPKGYTHIFEYTSPKNRVVTPYKTDKMILLGIRCNNTGTDIGDRDTLLYVSHIMSEQYGLNVRPAKSYKFSSKEKMLKAVQELPGLQEGFVCYKEGKRLKIKSEAYVKVHRLRGDCIPTPKRIAALVVTSEEEEYLSYFPEDGAMFQPYRDSFYNMCNEADVVFNIAGAMPDQKGFAYVVKGKCYSGSLFTARKNGTSFLKEFEKLDTSRKVKVLLTYKGD